jgi:FG-GAP-like repeat/RTX calcium-binding nonapeptide repeat (4 copies)
MSSLKSLMFGDIQYQVSAPVQNNFDGYYYQRVREVTRAGSVENEFIFRSSGPDSKMGLVDPEHGMDLAYGVAVSVYDLASVAYRVLNLTRDLMSGPQLERSVSKLVKDGVEGVEYPEALKVGFKSWPGTDAPWDPSTLKSDPTPQWAPGPVERLFVSNAPSNQIDQYSNLAGLSVVDRVPDGFGGRTVTTTSQDGFTVIFHERADGLVDKVTTRDPLGRETTEDNWDLNSNLLKKYYDTQNFHPYDRLEVDEDASGKITAAKPEIDGQPNNGGNIDFSSVGQVLGSALGRALAPNNQFVQLAAGTVVGAAGQRLAQAFAASLTTNGADISLADVFANFNVSIASAGASSVASFLVAELGTALNFHGFGAQLFDAAGGGFAGSVASQIASKMAGSAGVAGVSFTDAIGTINFGSAAASAAYGVSALFGSFLAHEFVPAQTHEGAVGGQLLGAVGAAAGISAAISGVLGTVLDFIIPGIGSLIGTIIGTLIGDAFGSTPHPAAVDLLDQAGTLYAARHYQVSASDGGDYSIPDQMTVPAVAIINAYLSAVKGAALDHYKQVTLGYQTDPASYIDGVPGHPAIGMSSSPDAAVQAAALDVLQNTEVIGGDLLIKRAHQNSSSAHAPVVPPDPNQTGDPGPAGTGILPSAAEQLAVMSGDIAVAQDYENYLNNREAINALMAANPNSAFTAGWIATFARVKELGLNHVNASDFTGGLVGYLDSVSKAGLGAVAANATVSHGGAGDSVITVAIRTANGVEVPGSLAAFADITTVSSDAGGQTIQLQFGVNLAQVGMHRLGAAAAGGDGAGDVWFGGDGGQSFNGTAGQDILAGGAGNDIIHGGAGWDFVQGGAGNDQLFGDDGNDILRGDAGNDHIDGGAGLDTAVYGAASGSYTLVSYNGSLGVLTHGADGSDRLDGVETLQFTDTAIAAGAVAAFDGLAYIASCPDLITAFGPNAQRGFDHYVSTGFAEGRAISFDPLQYIASNPDLITTFGANRQAGEQHYIGTGYYEHRSTNSFDPLEYIASNPDLITTFGPNRQAGEQHYIGTGYYEHRPTNSFDVLEYMASNPGMIAAGWTPAMALLHYINNGYSGHYPTASFDVAEYMASNPGMLAAHWTPAMALQHYVSSGYFDHDATTSFDPLEYMASNPSMIAAGWTPAQALQHYVSSGYVDHDPTNSFDPLEYLASNPDLIGPGVTPASALQHYVYRGFFEQRPTTSFDALEYIASNPDLITAFGPNRDAGEWHYIGTGYSEHRPTNSFDVLEYMASNPVMLAEGWTPAMALLHYVNNGYSGHYPTNSFDAVEYLASNPDLIAAGDTPASALQHYVYYGFSEHRPTTSFDALEYLASNPDLIAARLTADGARQHYVGAGYYEHRATTSFDPVAYLAANPDLIQAGTTAASAAQQYVSEGYFQHRPTVPPDPSHHWPVITSDGGGNTASIAVAENTTAVTTVTATDPDAGTTLAYSIVGGADQFLFRIDPSTHALSFVTAPNFEAPSDSDHNNAYVVQVEASDGALVDIQTIVVNVTDVFEPFKQVRDFNGDGKADILWQNDNGTPTVWLMDGQNLAVSGPLLANPGPAWHEKAAADFNGDGKADILWQNDNGTPTVWLMDGLNLAVSGPLLGNPGPAWHEKAAADFNGDGKADILWQNDNGTPTVWLMDGLNVAASGPMLANPGPAWHEKAAADFNGDGKADILWQNDNGTPTVWLMDGQNVAASGSLLANPGPAWHVKAAADFNGDGKADILWQNDNGTPTVWLMDGQNLAAAGPLLGNPGPAWHEKAAADFNGDGKADILWQHDNGTPTVWLMDGLNLAGSGPLLANPGSDWHII